MLKKKKVTKMGSDNRIPKYMRLYFFCWMPKSIIVVFVCLAGLKAKIACRFESPMKNKSEKYRHLFSYTSLKQNIKESVADCHMKRWTLLYYLIKCIFPVFRRNRLTHLNTSARLLRDWLEVTEHMLFWVNIDPLKRYLKSFKIYTPIKFLPGSDTVAWI